MNNSFCHVVIHCIMTHFVCLVEKNDILKTLIFDDFCKILSLLFAMSFLSVIMCIMNSKSNDTLYNINDQILFAQQTIAQASRSVNSSAKVRDGWF